MLSPSREDANIVVSELAGAPRLANDTAMGVGFAPLTPLERAVLAAERALRRSTARERGEDAKVSWEELLSHNLAKNGLGTL